MVAGGAINQIRQGPDNPTYIKLNYNPITKLSIAKDAEYFDELKGNNSKAMSYKTELISKLKSNNIHCSNTSSSRFSLSVKSMSFTETTSKRCENDDSGKEHCFLLNDLSVEMIVVVKDHLNNKEKTISSRVYESSKIKKRLIDNELRERTAGLNIETLTDRLLNKCSGMVSKYIRKKMK